MTAPMIRSTAAAAAGRSAVGIAAAASATSHMTAAARYFSQTTRAANAEEPAKEPTTESAAEATTTEAAAEPAAEPAAESAAESAAEPAEDNFAKMAAQLGADTAAVESPEAAPEGVETPHGLFVRNIVFDATEEHLKEAFSHYGPVTKTAIARDPRGLSRGFAFVWYENAEDMQKAIREANGMFWHGRQMVVAPREAKARQARERETNNPRRPNAPTDSLYIGNLPYETTDADLNELFRSLQGVKKVRVAVDRATGWPRGFAHCDFETVEDATAAMEAMQGRQLGDRTLRLDFAAAPQTDRRTPNPRAGNFKINRQF